MPGKLFIRRLRAVTGVVLFAFAATHLLNHSLGLISVRAMDQVGAWRVEINRSFLGTLILAGSLVVHATLGVAKLAQRRTWRMSRHDAVQLAFGVAIPLLLFKHIIGMRYVYEMFGVTDDYKNALFVLWPNFAVTQFALITLVWVHGCIGIHHLLRSRSWYRSALPAIYSLALLIPVLGYAGFAVAGREVRLIRKWKQPLTPEQIAELNAVIDWTWWGYLAILGSVVLFLCLIAARKRFQPTIKVAYPGNTQVTTAPGSTLLEISRAHNIPHASVCGGRARCSTCRVRVLQGMDDQPPPGDLESKVLQRVGATANVRLACQLRPVADLSVIPLLPAHRINDATVRQLDKYFWGVEQEVTLMFSDIRGFTQLSEQHLPYDVVFILNQYLVNMSQAITDAGGYVDKFMGDGIMAIFGMDRPVADGARDAITAARAMSGVLDALNQSLHSQIDEPFRIGIGVHTGVAILGRIGAASGTGAGGRVTALGDTVNTASRLEGACKDMQVELIVSADTLAAVGYPHDPGEMQTIAVRGRDATVSVLAQKRALLLQAVATPADRK